MLKRCFVVFTGATWFVHGFVLNKIKLVEKETIYF